MVPVRVVILLRSLDLSSFSYERFYALRKVKGENENQYHIDTAEGQC